MCSIYRLLLHKQIHENTEIIFEEIKMGFKKLREFWEKSIVYRVFIKKYKRYFIIGTLSLIAVDIINIFPPLIIKKAIDVFSTEVNLSKIAVLSGLFILVSLSQGVCRYLWRIHFIGTSFRCDYDLRMAFFGHIETLVADEHAHLYISTELTKLKWIHGCILALWAVIISGTSSALFINSRKRRLLEASLKKLSSAVEHSPCTVIITDVKGDIEYANPKFTQLTDYTRNEVIGKNPSFLKSGKTPPETYKQLWKTITSGYEWRGEFCNKKKNGKLYWESASISPITNIKGMITHFVAVKEDVTERKQIMEALQESEEKLKSILDNTTAVVYVKDISGQYTFINRQYEKLFHVKRDEVKGKTDYDLFPKEMADAFRANDLRVLKAKAPLEFDEVAPHENGLHTYISIKFPLYDSEGAIYAVCGISSDITERKRMEETIRQLREDLAREIRRREEMKNALVPVRRIVVRRTE